MISSPSGNLLQVAMETHHFYPFLLRTSSNPDGPWFPVRKRLNYRRPFWAPGRLGPSVIHWLDVSNANVLKWTNPEGSLGAHSIIYPCVFLLPGEGLLICVNLSFLPSFLFLCSPRQVAQRRRQLRRRPCTVTLSQAEPGPGQARTLCHKKNVR